MKLITLSLLSIFFLLLGPAQGQASGLRTSDERQTLSIGGEDRSYILRIPAHVAGSKRRVPFVIVLHGGGGNGLNAEKMTGFTDKARKEGFIVVYPEGSGRREDKLLTWNAGHCCGYAMENNIDDVGYISALIDHLVATQPVDPDRIYATGMSNGGMMTHRLGIELAGKITGIAPVAAGMFGDESRPSNAVAAIIINGMLDKSVPPAGGKNGGRFADSWDGTPLKPFIYQSAFWAGVNGCGPEGPEENLVGKVKSWNYDCPRGSDVIHYLVLDNGHAWPGGKSGTRMGDKPSSSMNATDLIWDFFRIQTGHRRI